MFALASAATRRQQVHFPSRNQLQQQYSPYTFPRLYNHRYNPQSPTDQLSLAVEPSPTCLEIQHQAYDIQVQEHHNGMLQFIEKVKRNTENMKDSDLKDFAMELVEDCQSWADCWRLAADIAGEAWKAFQKAGVIIEDEVHSILDKSRCLGEQAIRRAVRNSRRVLRLARKYPEIYEGQQDEWDELECLVSRVDKMIEGRLRTDEESVAELKAILDTVHTWHENALEKIRVTGGELDRALLDGELTSDDEDAKSDELEPGATRVVRDGLEGCFKSIDALDSYVTPGGEQHVELASDGVYGRDSEHLRDVYDELRKSNLQWKWVSRIINSLNLITVITFTGVGIVGLFLRRSAPDKNKPK